MLGDKPELTPNGTPDVVGTYKPLASDLIKFPIEIVSAAEIKIDPQNTLAEQDQDRLESLCMLFGVG